MQTDKTSFFYRSSLLQYQLYNHEYTDQVVDPYLVDSCRITFTVPLPRSLLGLGRIYCGREKSVPFLDHSRRLIAPTVGQ
jgi:hypothetical protein